MTRKDNANYVFGFNEFATLQDFVNHFANQPLLGSDAGMNNCKHMHIQTHTQKTKWVILWTFSVTWQQLKVEAHIYIYVCATYLDEYD